MTVRIALAPDDFHDLQCKTIDWVEDKLKHGTDDQELFLIWSEENGLTTASRDQVPEQRCTILKECCQPKDYRLYDGSYVSDTISQFAKRFECRRAKSEQEKL